MPVWVAVMVQVPGLTPVTVVPLTVQTAGVVEAKATVRPEETVALAVTVLPTVRVEGVKPMAPMVWLPLPTVMFCVTWVGAL